MTDGGVTRGTMNPPRRPLLPDPEITYRAVLEKARRRALGEEDPDDFEIVRKVREEVEAERASR